MLASIICLAIVAGPSNEVTAAERRALEYRQNLLAGRVELSVERKYPRRRHSLMVALFDGDKLRVDLVQDGARFPDQYVRNGDDLIIHRWNGDDTLALDIFDTSNIANEEVPHVPLFDVRCLGNVVSTVGTMHAYKPDSLLSRQHRLNVTDEVVVVEDEKIAIVTYEYRNTRTVTLRIAIDRGYSVLEAVKTYDRGGKRIVDEVRNEIRKYGNKWFPEKVTFSRRVDGKLVGMEETNIVEAEFSERLPGRLFSIAGLDVPANTAVRQIPGSGMAMAWDGNGIVPLTRGQRLENEGARDGVGVRSRFRLLGMVSFAVALFSFVWLMLRSKRD